MTLDLKTLRRGVKFNLDVTLKKNQESYFCLLLLQVPFPMGANIRPRPSQIRATTSGENNQEILPGSVIGEDVYGDVSTVSGKESD